MSQLTPRNQAALKRINDRERAQRESKPVYNSRRAAQPQRIKVNVMSSLATAVAVRFVW